MMSFMYVYTQHIRTLLLLVLSLPLYPHPSRTSALFFVLLSFTYLFSFYFSFFSLFIVALLPRIASHHTYHHPDQSGHGAILPLRRTLAY